MKFRAFSDISFSCSDNRSLTYGKGCIVPIFCFDEDRLGIRVPNLNETKVKIGEQSEDVSVTIVFNEAKDLERAEALLLESGVTVFRSSSPENSFRVNKKDLKYCMSKLKANEINFDVKSQPSYKIPSFLVYEVTSNVVANGIIKNVFCETQLRNNVLFKTYSVFDLLNEGVRLEALSDYISKYPRCFVEGNKIRIPVCPVEHLSFIEKVRKLDRRKVEDWEIVGTVDEVVVNESGSRDFLILEKYLTSSRSKILKKYLESLGDKVEITPSGLVKLRGISPKVFENYLDEPVFEGVKVQFKSDSLAKINFLKENEGDSRDVSMRELENPGVDEDEEENEEDRGFELDSDSVETSETDVEEFPLDGSGEEDLSSDVDDGMELSADDTSDEEVSDVGDLVVSDETSDEEVSTSSDEEDLAVFDDVSSDDGEEEDEDSDRKEVFEGKRGGRKPMRKKKFSDIKKERDYLMKFYDERQIEESLDDPEDEDVEDSDLVEDEDESPDLVVDDEVEDTEEDVSSDDEDLFGFDDEEEGGDLLVDDEEDLETVDDEDDDLVGDEEEDLETIDDLVDDDEEEDLEIVDDDLVDDEEDFVDEEDEEEKLSEKFDDDEEDFLKEKHLRPLVRRAKLSRIHK